MHWDLRLEHEGTLASLGDPEGHPGRPQAQQPRGPDRGPPARVPRLPRRDPGRQLRRRDDEDLRPRHVRGPQVARQGGHGHVPRRARARQVRAVPDRRQELDDPPDGPAGGPGRGSRCRSGSSRCWRAPGELPRGRRLGVRDQVGRRARDRLRRGRPARSSRAATATTSRRATPSCASSGRALGTHEAILDGEVVSFDETGVPSFQRLQRRMHLTSEGQVRRLVAVRAGRLHDLRPAVARRPLAARADLRRRAARCWPSSSWPGPTWQVAGAPRGQRRGACWRPSRAQGLEGIVAKRLDCPYIPGRRSQRLGEGQEQAHHRRRGRRLDAAARAAARAGSARSSSASTRTASCATPASVGLRLHRVRAASACRALLDALARDDQPVHRHAAAEAGARFVEPELVASVEYGDMTDDGTLRHPVYKGLRDDIAPEVVGPARMTSLRRPPPRSVRM